MPAWQGAMTHRAENCRVWVASWIKPWKLEPTVKTHEEDTAVRAVSPPSVYLHRFFQGTYPRYIEGGVFLFPHLPDVWKGGVFVGRLRKRDAVRLKSARLTAPTEKSGQGANVATTCVRNESLAASNGCMEVSLRCFHAVLQV